MLPFFQRCETVVPVVQLFLCALNSFLLISLMVHFKSHIFLFLPSRNIFVLILNLLCEMKYDILYFCCFCEGFRVTKKPWNVVGSHCLLSGTVCWCASAWIWHALCVLLCWGFTQCGSYCTVVGSRLNYTHWNAKHMVLYLKWHKQIALSKQIRLCHWLQVLEGKRIFVYIWAEMRTWNQVSQWLVYGKWICFSSEYFTWITFS